jgi:hypothetical protein
MRRQSVSTGESPRIARPAVGRGGDGRERRRLIHTAVGEPFFHLEWHVDPADVPISLGAANAWKPKPSALEHIFHID